MTQFEEYYRIWFADEVEPEGGLWIYYGVDKNRISYELNFDYTGKKDQLDSIDWYIENGYKIECIKSEHKKFTDRLLEEQLKQNQKIEDLIWGTKPSEQTGNITQDSAGRITQVAFTDTPEDAEQIIFYMKKHIELKEVIQNMIDSLDEGGEMTLTKDSIIVHALREAIK